MALPAPRSGDADRLAPRPFLRKVLLRLPQSLQDAVVPPPMGWIIGVDTEREVIYSLQDPLGAYVTVTSVNQIDGKLYLGSIAMHAVGRVDLPVAFNKNHAR